MTTTKNKIVGTEPMLSVFRSRGVSEREGIETINAISQRLGEPADLKVALDNLNRGLRDLSRRDRFDVVCNIFGGYHSTRASILLDAVY